MKRAFLVLAGGAKRGPVVKLGESQFGRVLFSGGDRALYLYAKGGRGPAAAWMPTRSGRSSAAAAAARSPTRAGRYSYVHDPVGEVPCNDVFEFGGAWFALTAKGKRPA